MNTDSQDLPEFASVSQLQRNYAGLLERLKSATNKILILKKGKLEAVIVSPDYFRELLKRTATQEEREALKAIGMYKDEKKHKKLHQLKKPDELFT